MYFSYMVVVVTKFISSRDTKWPASKSYYAVRVQQMLPIILCVQQLHIQFTNSESKLSILIQAQNRTIQ